LQSTSLTFDCTGEAGNHPANLLLILGFTAAYSAANARFQQRLAHQGYRAGHPRWDSVESVSLAVLVSRIGRVAEIRMREICAALAVAVDCSL